MSEEILTTVNSDQFTGFKPGTVEIVRIVKHSPLWRRLLVKLGFKRFARYEVEYVFVYRDRHIETRTQ